MLITTATTAPLQESHAHAAHAHAARVQALHGGRQGAAALATIALLVEGRDLTGEDPLRVQDYYG